MAQSPEDRAAHAAQTKFDIFLDCLARHIAQQWLHEQREQEQSGAASPDGEVPKEVSPRSLPESLIREPQDEDF